MLMKRKGVTRKLGVLLDFDATLEVEVSLDVAEEQKAIQVARNHYQAIGGAQVLRLRQLWSSKKTECLTSHRGACGESPYETKWK